MENITFDSLPLAVATLIGEVRSLRGMLETLLQAGAEESRQRSDDLVGVDEACRILRRKKSTIYHMVRAGALPFYKIGKMLEFRPSELMAWQSRHSASAAKSAEELMEEMSATVRNRPKNSW